MGCERHFSAAGGMVSRGASSDVMQETMKDFET
jgi:hypothetical protein